MATAKAKATNTAPKKTTGDQAAMTGEQAVALLGRSSVRALVPKLLSASAATRERAFEALERAHETDEPYVTTFVIPEREAIARLHVATHLAFPPQPLSWQDPAHELVFPLVRSPHAALVAPIRALYPAAPPRVQTAMLAILGAIATRRAAQAILACVVEHGWPARIYPRVWTELRKLARFGDALFPELLLRAGKHIGDVTDVFAGAVASGALDIDALDLAPLAPLVEAELAKVLARAERAQRPGAAITWRFGERYAPIRAACGTWLDLAGYFARPRLVALVRRGTKLADPRLAAFAASAHLRQGGTVAAPLLARIAASHETRDLLWSLLDTLDQARLFPEAWRTWDAFAASHMVAWLAHPSELGREPDAIEQMAVLSHRGRCIYVFRFLDGKTWKAGLCGPFVKRGRPAPVYGPATFSRFEPWGTRTAEEHATAILGTVSRFRAA